MFINSRIFREIEAVEPKLFEDFDGDYSYELDNVLYQLAEKEIQDDKEEYSDDEWEDLITEQMQSLIGIFRINVEGLLYSALYDWFDGKENMRNLIRSAFFDGDYLYYVTGCGYDTISADLLNGSADGKAKDEFIEFINKN